MEKKRTLIITAPHVQALMDIEGFGLNAALCASERLVMRYGYPAYAVSCDWVDRLPSTGLPVLTDAILGCEGPGPLVDFSRASEETPLFI